MLKQYLTWMSRLLLIAMLGIIGSVLAQPIIPLPPPPDANFMTELLTNPGFEIDANNNKLPDGWKGKNTDLKYRDGLVCNKPGKPVAHSGNCAFMFRGNVLGGVSRLWQPIANPQALAHGTRITISAMVDLRSANPAGIFGQVKYTYRDNTTLKPLTQVTSTAHRTINRGKYVTLTGTGIINLPEGVTIESAKVTFGYKGRSGKFYIDTASVAVATHSPPVQLISGIVGPMEHERRFPISVDGDTIAIGKPDHANFSGSVHVFVRDGIAWTEQAVLTLDAEQITEPELFGMSVAISGDTLVAGSANGASGKGSLFVFVRSEGTWTQQARLYPDDGAGPSDFGRSVAIDGDTIVTGANVGGIHGSAYVFIRDGTDWNQQTQLSVTEAYTYGEFGVSVAIDNDTIIVGAHRQSSESSIYAGAAYIFVRDGATWNLQQKLTTGKDFSRFGYCVDISGNVALIGAIEEYISGSARQGSAHIFLRDDGVWKQHSQLYGFDTTSDWYEFGRVVALDGDTAIVGASYNDGYHAPTYVFEHNGKNWIHQLELLIDDEISAYPRVSALAVSGKTVVIGVFDTHTEQGSVWVIDLQ